MSRPNYKPIQTRLTEEAAAMRKATAKKVRKPSVYPPVRFWGIVALIWLVVYAAWVYPMKHPGPAPKVNIHYSPQPNWQNAPAVQPKSDNQ